MIHNCNGKCGCAVSVTALVLVIIGALNWGLVGIGILMHTELNVVHLVLASCPTVEAIVYILVGIAGVVKIFGCPCAKCKAGCANCTVASTVTNVPETKI